MRTKALILVLLSLAGFTGRAQGFGVRNNNNVTDSEGIITESQVWNITSLQDCPVTYFATNDGLFSYDGARMRRHYSSSATTLRDLAYDRQSGRLYSAGNNGFGWWEEDDFGFMEYHPLEIGEYSATYRDFWKVCISGGGLVFFQSIGRICIYNPDTGLVETLCPEGRFRYMHEVGGDVYVQDSDRLLRIADDGRLSQVCTVQDRIMNIVQCGDRRIAALERTGLMELLQDGLVPMDAASNNTLARAKVMSLAVYDGSRLLVGTTSGGLYVTDSLGRILPDARKRLSASDATVLSLSVDMNGDIWLGMEAGVARIDVHSNSFYLSDSRLGRVRGVMPLEDGSLLVGSNKGAFLCENGVVSPVPGTTGSVWSLAAFDGGHYIAHDQGLFVLDKRHRAVPVFKGTGVMSIVRCNAHPDMFICGTYNGLALLRMVNGSLGFETYIANYGGFCRHILIDDKDRLWVRDSHKGFIRLTLDGSHTSVVDREDFVLVHSESDIVHDIVLDGKQLLCCNTQTYSIEPENGMLVRSQNGDALLERFSREYGIPEDRNASGPFLLEEGCYATGLWGQICFSYGRKEVAESLYVSQVEMLGVNQRRNAPLGDGRVSVPFDMNTVLVHLAGNVGRGVIEYSIGPESGTWKTWRLDQPVQVSALSFGNHDISFRIPGTEFVSCTVSLKILPPWYLTWQAFFGYALALLILFAGIRTVSIRQARKKQEQERMAADLKAKSKELANINFNNAKRNRQLNEIKGMLSDRKTVSMIDGFLADESDWEKSEEYFNVIYDGLLEKLKSTYPGISKTDMKLCVYTKLNLSTKEIADLMNISVRSVEMARYRLRKRLGLSPGEDIGKMLKDISG